MRFFTLLIIIIFTFENAAFSFSDICSDQHTDYALSQVAYKDIKSVSKSLLKSFLNNHKKNDNLVHCSIHCLHHNYSLMTSEVSITSHALDLNYQAYNFTYNKAYLGAIFRPPII